MKKDKEKKKQRSKKEKKAAKKQTARAQGKRSGERSKQEKKGGRKKEKAAAKQSAEKPKKRANPSRTAGGRVPQGRTLKTKDKYLDKKAKEPEKERPVVVIEANENNDLAVVQLTSREGKDRTRLKNYQQGESLFKHYVEIEDDEGKPIRVNEKFKENHPNMDVSRQDVDTIIDTVLNHSKPMQKNRKRIDKLRGKKE